MSTRSRPTGVMVVGVLYLILGILALVAAIGFFQWAGLPVDELSSQQPNAPIWLVEGGSFILTALGVVVFLIGAVNLIMAIGCFMGWGWIWSYALLFAILNIVLSMFNALSQGFSMGAIWTGMIGAILPILILIYLSTGKVRAYFGKV